MAVLGTGVVCWISIWGFLRIDDSPDPHGPVVGTA